MKRTLLLGLTLAAGLAFAAQPAPTMPAAGYAPEPDYGLVVTEYPSSTSFEYDVRAKGPLGDHAGPSDTVWDAAMRNCDIRGGYISEYHDGYKRRYVDTREGAVRANAYVTCRVPPEISEPIDTAQAPVARLSAGSGISPDTGRVDATGPLQPAYRAARDLVRRTCKEKGRGVDFMSVHVSERPGAHWPVEANFACGAPLDRSAGAIPAAGDPPGP